MASGRATLKNALGAASSCSLSAHAAAAKVTAVALARRHVLAQLARLGTPTPLAVRLRSLLEAALNHSIAADLHYRDWLSGQRSRCSRTPTPDMTAAQLEDRMATAAKRSFLAAFNPLVRQLHLRTWSADQI